MIKFVDIGEERACELATDKEERDMESDITRALMGEPEITWQAAGAELVSEGEQRELFGKLCDGVEWKNIGGTGRWDFTAAMRVSIAARGFKLKYPLAADYSHGYGHYPFVAIRAIHNDGDGVIELFSLCDDEKSKGIPVLCKFYPFQTT